MKNKKLKLLDTVVHPGETANLALPMPEQYSCAPLFMPIKIINGNKAGSTLVIFSGFKGNELNGLEIANRIVESISPSEISGTIISIPVVNVYGLTHYPSILPSDTKLINCFPGKENGTYGERIAYFFTNEILKKADYCIELLTGDINHNILPQVYCNFNNDKARELAKIFNSPVVTDLNIENNKLRQTTEELHIPLLIYKSGEAMRFDNNSIELGVKGIMNVMKGIGMLSAKPTKDINPIFSRHEAWITANKSGILHTNVNLGQTIEKNESIGTISDPFRIDFVDPIKADKKGIVVGINTSPLVYEGLFLFKIASFLDYDKAESIIEAWDKKQPDSYIE